MKVSHLDRWANFHVSDPSGVKFHRPQVQTKRRLSVRPSAVWFTDTSAPNAWHCGTASCVEADPIAWNYWKKRGRTGTQKVNCKSSATTPDADTRSHRCSNLHYIQLHWKFGDYAGLQGSRDARVWHSMGFCESSCEFWCTFIVTNGVHSKRVVCRT